MTNIKTQAESPPIICILGPTASGKTRHAVSISEAINAEIISADSRQVYRGLTIGSGKDLHEYKEVPYHLIDIVDPSEEYNIFRFVTDYNTAIDSIKSRNKHPVLCGGSGLYVDAILSRYKFTKANDTRVRKLLENWSHTELIEQLTSRRPQQHNTTNLNSSRRTAMALAIAEAEDQGEEVIQATPMTPILFATKLDRETLKQRIKERLEERFNQGMIEEVEWLIKEGVPAQKLDFFGLEYRYVNKYLSGELNYNDMFQKLNSEIVRFSKQQEKWLRNFAKKGHAVNWLEDDLELNLKRIRHAI